MAFQKFDDDLKSTNPQNTSQFKRKNRVLLGGAYSIIEPLGLMHLAGLARDLNWDRKFYLVKDNDFTSFFEVVRDFKPNVIGFNIYTGNHIQTFEAFQRIKKDFPHIITVVGGPHATYFPIECNRYSDYVVMSEGFGAFRKILNEETEPGILPMLATERFPHPDRETFYKDYPEHAKSRIKSIISMTGCPYSCTYCYNSSTAAEIKDNVSSELALDIQNLIGKNCLFPKNIRSVDDVIKEAREVAERWSPNVFYFQDDVHGFDTNNWLPEFGRRWTKEIGTPYHAQMRWEMTKSQKRLDQLQSAGCFGLTLAIEAANPIIRKEVLNRAMPNELMFEGMRSIVSRGLRVRTEQITGLPYGATTAPTEMNLDADLRLIETNVKLKQLTGGPTIAWASTFAPYKGTKLGTYCKEYGYYNGDNNDVPDTFFERSVLKFLNQWVGPELKQKINDPAVWLDAPNLERYRNQNAELRRIFNFVTLIPNGHLLAASYLKSSESYSFERLGQETESHLKKLSHTSPESAGLLKRIVEIKQNVTKISHKLEEQKLVRSLAGYFGCIPKGELAAKRFLQYAKEKGGLTKTVLSTATRHHLYDEVLYSTNSIKKYQK